MDGWGERVLCVVNERKVCVFTCFSTNRTFFFSLFLSMRKPHVLCNRCIVHVFAFQLRFGFTAHGILRGSRTQFMFAFHCAVMGLVITMNTAYIVCIPYIDHIVNVYHTTIFGNTLAEN